MQDSPGPKQMLEILHTQPLETPVRPDAALIKFEGIKTESESKTNERV